MLVATKDLSSGVENRIPIGQQSVRWSTHYIESRQFLEKNADNSSARASAKL